MNFIMLIILSSEFWNISILYVKFCTLPAITHLQPITLSLSNHLSALCFCEFECFSYLIEVKSCSTCVLRLISFSLLFSVLQHLTKFPSVLRLSHNISCGIHCVLFIHQWAFGLPPPLGYPVIAAMSMDLQISLSPYSWFQFLFLWILEEVSKSLWNIELKNDVCFPLSFETLIQPEVRSLKCIASFSQLFSNFHTAVRF